MRVETFETFAQLRSLTATTIFTEAGTLTSLSTANTGKIVAKSGDSVFLWIKQSQVSYELTLTSDLGNADRITFSSIAMFYSAIGLSVFFLETFFLVVFGAGAGLASATFCASVLGSTTSHL